MAQKVIVSLKKYEEVLSDLANAKIALKYATMDFTLAKIENVQNLAYLADKVLRLDERADRLFNYLTDEQIYRLARKEA